MRALVGGVLLWGLAWALPEGGRAEPSAPAPQERAADRWEPWDAGMGFGGGVTDRVTVGAGRAVSIALPRAVVLTVCDDASLLETAGVGETIRISGKKAGRTQCGFWFEDNPVPHRLFEVTVRAAEADAGKSDGG